MGDWDRKKDLVYNVKDKEEHINEDVQKEPIIALVDSILYKAIDVGASDIHLEPNETNLRLRYRIDGILYDQDSISFDLSNSVLSRLKILSSLDIAQKRVPQDGKFRVNIKDKKNKKYNNIDLRVSTFPSIYGEKMVIRILDRTQNLIELESLGCSAEVLQKLSNIIKHPYGFFLVTGPTGSGKTTTLYAILSKLNDSRRNIVTMEDPVEYNLDGITQSQINPKAGFTFEKGLRSILRQDPDVIMVGEIRDKQTAQIAIEAALTGHLVFSTLHTNDSVSAVTRLIDMGIEPFLITASLSGVLAQRLVRKLCSCKKKSNFNISEYENFNGYDLKESYISLGCNECLNLGYKGRTGIFELLIIDDVIRDLILNKESSDGIAKIAIKNGLKTLLDDGIYKIQKGIVSIDEILRGIKS